MELTGRTYIFFAATLVLLTGTFKFYDEAQQDGAAPGTIMTRAAAAAECDRNAVDLGEFRLGCQTNTGGDVRVRRIESGGSSILSGGGAKFVSAGN